MIDLANNTSADFRDKVLYSMVNDFGLSLDVSESSFIYKIVDAISKGQVDVNVAVSQLLKNNSFDSLSGSSLDSFFNIFGITRAKSFDDNYTFNLAFSGKKRFTVLKGTLLEYDDDIYMVNFDTDFTSYFGVTNIQLLATKITNVSFMPFDVLEIGDIKIDYDGIESNYPNEELDRSIVDRLMLTDIDYGLKDKETDTAFLNRSKSLFQFYSSSSIEKILLSLNSITVINKAFVRKDGLTTRVYIIPDDLKNLENAVKTAKEIVNYYKSSTVIINRPNYVQFKITGLLDQVPASVRQDITTFIGTYTNDIYINNNIFDRTEFEDKLLRFARKLTDFRINLGFVQIKYKVYAQANFELLISSGNIYQNKTKTFTDSMFNIESVS